MTTCAFDTETLGFDWFDDQTAFLSSWAGADSEDVAALGDPAQSATYLQSLSRADVLVGHNLKFDIHQTRATTGFDVMQLGKELHDTDTMSRVLYPRGSGGNNSHKLKDLGAIHVRADAADSEAHIKEMAEAIGVSLNQTGAYYQVWRAYPEVMEKYAAMDARLTYDLFEKFRHEIVGNSIYELERRIMPILVEAERIGVCVDQAVVEPLFEEHTRKHAELWDDLVETFGETALGGEGSEAALLEVLTEKLGIPLYRRTDTGKIATNKYALAEFKKEWPVLSLFEDFRTETRFLNTYIGPMRGREIVHCSFEQLGAWTSRMSCRRPNMQNLPAHDDATGEGAKLRSMFTPRPGYGFVVCDYEGIEARLLAYYLGPRGEQYRDLFEQGHDPHGWLAAQIHGGMMADYAKGTAGAEKRAKAKNSMFALVYGAGGPRLLDMNPELKTVDNAKAFASKIKASIPGYSHLNKRVKRKVKMDGYVTTLYGMRLPVNKEKPYVGLSALIQGSAAGVMKQGAVNAHEVVQDLGAYPLLFVHDEGVYECPLENLDECLLRVTDAMEAAAPEGFRPPLTVEGSISTISYADAK